MYDFRLNTLAKTLPDWMLDNEGYRYNLLLGGDIRPTELLIRRRQVYLNLFLFANGDLCILQGTMPIGHTTWQYHLSVLYRIITMLVHGRTTLQEWWATARNL